MDSFHNISYFSVALNAEIQLIHIEKIIQLLLSGFFLLNIYILCSYTR